MSTFIRIVAIALLALICWQITVKQKEAGKEPETKTVIVNGEEKEVVQESGVLGIFWWYAAAFLVGGFLITTWIVPMLGEAAGTATYSSGEQATPDPYLKAKGKMAIGDYEGAISLFEESAAANPGDAHPIKDIVNVCVDKLRDPARAMARIEEALHSSWPEDDEAYFLFKLADLHAEHGEGQDRVVSILQNIREKFPDTRHCANAIHRLREINPALVVAQGGFSPPPPGGPGNPGPAIPPPNA